MRFVTLLPIFMLFHIETASALSCENLTGSKSVNFAHAFLESSRTHLYIRKNQAAPKNKTLKPGKAYTVAIAAKSGHLVLGEKTPAIHASLVPRVLGLSHSGTHLALEYMHKDDGGSMGSSLGTIRLNKDQSIDVSGYNTKNESLYDAIAIANLVKKIYPEALIRLTPGRLRNIHTRPETVMYLTAEDREIVNIDNEWVIR